jgi:hypothetical protein
MATTLFGILVPGANVRRGSDDRGGCRSFLGKPGLAHALDNLLALLQEDWIVGGGAGAEMAEREFRIDRKSGSGCGPRFIETTELRESGREIDVRDEIIGVDFDRSAVPGDSFLVSAKKQLGEGRSTSRTWASVSSAWPFTTLA